MTIYMFRELNTKEIEELTPELIDNWESIPEKEEALILGLTTYRTKYTCYKEHLPIRIVSTGNCVACSRSNSRDFYHKNKEKLNKQCKDYHVNRYKEDPKFRAAILMRNNLKRVIKLAKCKKREDTLRSLGIPLKISC